MPFGSQHIGGEYSAIIDLAQHICSYQKLQICKSFCMGKTAIKEEYQDKLREDARISKIVGKNLRHIHKSTKTENDTEISFPKLAMLTALHNVSLRRFEKGESGMTVATLVRLKEAFGCSWDDLLDGCESEIVKNRKKLFGTFSPKQRDS